MGSSGKEWLTLTEASQLLGIHPTTLRRWADSGSMRCLRTPGGHRRFRAAELAAWVNGRQTTEIRLQNVVGLTRQEMARGHVSGEAWYLAFDQEEDRQRMRDAGRRLLGLGLQYAGRTLDSEPVLQEGRRIGHFYGEQCARRSMSLVDAVRAFFFFRESLLRAARPGLVTAGQYDVEDVRIHRRLRQFLDEVMYACLASYEAACLDLLPAGEAA